MQYENLFRAAELWLEQSFASLNCCVDKVEAVPSVPYVSMSLHPLPLSLRLQWVVRLRKRSLLGVSVYPGYPWGHTPKFLVPLSLEFSQNSAKELLSINPEEPYLCLQQKIFERHAVCAVSSTLILCSISFNRCCKFASILLADSTISKYHWIAVAKTFVSTLSLWQRSR